MRIETVERLLEGIAEHQVSTLEGPDPGHRRALGIVELSQTIGLSFPSTKAAVRYSRDMGWVKVEKITSGYMGGAPRYIAMLTRSGWDTLRLMRQNSHAS